MDLFKYFNRIRCFFDRYFGVEAFVYVLLACTFGPLYFFWLLWVWVLFIADTVVV